MLIAIGVMLLLVLPVDRKQKKLAFISLHMSTYLINCYVLINKLFSHRGTHPIFPAWILSTLRFPLHGSPPHPAWDLTPCPGPLQFHTLSEDAVDSHSRQFCSIKFLQTLNL